METISEDLPRLSSSSWGFWPGAQELQISTRTSHIFLPSCWLHGWGMQTVPPVPGIHCRHPSETRVNIPLGEEERSKSLTDHFGAWEPTGFRKWSKSLSLLSFSISGKQFALFSSHLAILQSPPSPSPACRHVQDLLSHRPPLGRLSCGSCTTYIREGATWTAQVTWSQTKLYTGFLLGSGDFRSTARASIILMNYWQDIIPVQEQDKKDSRWVHHRDGTIGKELHHFHAGMREPGTTFRDMFWCRIRFLAPG